MTEAGAAPHVLIVEAPFYQDIVGALARGATEVLTAAGATFDRVAVPGALEVPAAIRMAVLAGEGEPGRRPYDGFLALGCVIRGETAHYEIVCSESARGLQDLAVVHGLAIANGVLTCDNRAQALARARVEEKNKGGDAARACLTMIALRRQFGLGPR